MKDLTPLSDIAAAFRQGYPSVLIGMLKAEMPFTDAQLAAASNSADRDVQIAFCRIHGQHCNR